MVHKAFVILGRIFWVLRLISDLISDYFFSLFDPDKHEPLPPISHSILLESASILAEKIRTRQLKSEDVVKAFIDRIREVNTIINAMVDERFSEAILEAQEADHLIASGEKSVEDLARDLPFLGVPFTSKESIGAKGLRQTGGLISRKTFVAKVDAPAIVRMTKSGAILLGVCNTSELLLLLETKNNVYGRSKNCYDTTRTCGGSSGGDGTLLAACGTVLALGTDIAGGIRVPGLCNGIFGHRPTPRCVSVEGIFPLGHGHLSYYQSIGPMCRYAVDLLPMFKCLVDNPESAERLQLDEPVDFRNLKIYYQEDDGGNPFVTPTDMEIRNAMRKALFHFENTYGIKAIKINLREFYYGWQIFGTKMRTIAKNSFSALMANGKGEANGVREFLKWVIGCSDHTLPAIMLSMYENILYEDPQYINEMDSKLGSLKGQLDELLGKDGVFFCPTLPKPALHHNQSIGLPFNFTYTCIINVLGFPSTHCPMGLNSQGLPIGFQVVGNSYQDRLNFAVARDLERVFVGWVPPSPLMG